MCTHTHLSVQILTLLKSEINQVELLQCFGNPKIINIHKAIIEYAIARLFLIYFWPILFLNA